jgi:SAM-dependent methyltransferase
VPKWADSPATDPLLTQRFNPTSERLDREMVRSGLTAVRPLYAAMLIRSLRPRRLLDVGCKSGWLLGYLADVEGVATLVGLDRDRVRWEASPRARFVIGDALALPFAQRLFDVVALLDVIEHLPRGTEARAVREAARALLPSGRLVLSTPARWLPGTLLDPAFWLIDHRHYRLDSLLSLVRGAGLEPVFTDTRGGWAQVAGLPLLYVTERLKMSLPRSGRLRSWAVREYGRPGRYSHFVVARKPG